LLVLFQYSHQKRQQLNKLFLRSMIFDCYRKRSDQRE